MTPINLCQLCGGPMPVGEEMFNYHGYSGPCPKPPKIKIPPPTIDDYKSELLQARKIICSEYCGGAHHPQCSRFAKLAPFEGDTRG